MQGRDRAFYQFSMTSAHLQENKKKSKMGGFDFTPAPNTIIFLVPREGDLKKNLHKKLHHIYMDSLPLQISSITLTGTVVTWITNIYLQLTKLFNFLSLCNAILPFIIWLELVNI